MTRKIEGLRAWTKGKLPPLAGNQAGAVMRLLRAKAALDAAAPLDRQGVVDSLRAWREARDAFVAHLDGSGPFAVDAAGAPPLVVFAYREVAMQRHLYHVAEGGFKAVAEWEAAWGRFLRVVADHVLHCPACDGRTVHDALSLGWPECIECGFTGVGS